MATITLNGENYTLGTDIAISIGYNMQCRPCITKSVIDKEEDGRLFCTNGGVDMYVSDDDMKTFYLNTPENRKKLKQLMTN